MTFTFILSKPILFLFLHFYLLVFILEGIPVFPSVVDAQLQFLLELKYNFLNKNTVFTSKKSNGQFTTSLGKSLITFLNLLGFNFQPCILTFLQLADGGAFKKQLPIPFLKAYVNIVYYVMFCKQKFSSPLYCHSLGSNFIG